MAPDLSFISAPMVNQSDLPFRVLTRKYGATLTYTQMLIPERLINDQDYFEFHRRDLTTKIDGLETPVVVQLCGNDPQIVVEAGRKLQDCCDGIGVRLDLNLGCPQEAARDGHYGAYLLGQNDWPLVEEIVSAMSASFVVPVSTKIRLCQPQTKTLEFAERLERSGSSWITLHARTVSARRRRQGAADLSEVKRLKDSGKLHIPLISNGNVRVHTDLGDNLKYTGADGLMVGETLLGNPCIFTNKIPDPVDISLEYLNLCRTYANTIPISSVKTHVRHFVDFQCSRQTWFTTFRTALGNCATLDEIEHLLCRKVERWRGRPPREFNGTSDDESDGGVESLNDRKSVSESNFRFSKTGELPNLLDTDDLNLDLGLS
ncbi:FMN-linked oxidoreductase [Dendrothele bispora CBS 962.96]|uniref:tRNA-dihydrouridine(16/17) synthase [NAD(P)(+)] n=1 Tax=Dendrothele bispora (strain CBS 962.96) TaxID=1314807 RepID=A0A4S8KSF4_DENBC|nr:FMN-linked oxidoreductase [Dendrothele bispora CBS 962.96]